MLACSPRSHGLSGLAGPRAHKDWKADHATAKECAVDAAHVAGLLAICTRDAAHPGRKDRQQNAANEHVAGHVQYATVAAQTNWTWNACARGSAWPPVQHHLLLRHEGSLLNETWMKVEPLAMGPRPRVKRHEPKERIRQKRWSAYDSLLLIGVPNVGVGNSVDGLAEVCAGDASSATYHMLEIG